eukprot:3235478-Pyramimonas_sp.AAC.1
MQSVRQLIAGDSFQAHAFCHRTVLPLCTPVRSTSARRAGLLHKQSRTARMRESASATSAAAGDVQTFASKELDTRGGAFVQHCDFAIQGSPEGPLSGLTFAIKDLFDVKGYKTGFGNPTWLDTHDIADRTAPAVQMLLDAGASA